MVRGLKVRLRGIVQPLYMYPSHSLFSIHGTMGFCRGGLEFENEVAVEAKETRNRGLAVSLFEDRR